MDITLYISRFLYHIRYQMIFGSLIVTALFVYFSQFLPKTYTVTTSIYTGIASSTGLEEEDKPTWTEVNNTFDNLIHLTEAKGTLERVSVNLFALNMIYGDPAVDNTYITAKHFKELQRITPEEVTNLIDKSSYENTIKNLNQYKQEGGTGNFLSELFSADNPHYGYKGLSKVSVKRIGNSDLVEISFKSNDPGIAMNTVKLINDELMQSYDGLRYKAANDVVRYYEEQLKILRAQLDKIENSLTAYNVDNGVINYGEQTKAIAIAFTNYEDRYEQALRDYESSSRLVSELDKQMETRTKLFKTNTAFIDALNEISTVNGKITEIETFSSEEAQSKDSLLEEYRENLLKAEKKIAELSNDMNAYKYSKEGVAIEDMVNQWLNETVKNIKSRAELKVLDERRKEFADQYKVFSPIGTQIGRMERDIRVKEESYLEVLHALNLAKMKQKNIQLTSASLNTITSPSFPLISDGNKRMLFTIVAFMGSLIFIIGCNLIIELLDRTLRDFERTKRLTGMPVLGAFTGNTQLKYRGYIKACNRISAAYACDKLNRYLHPGKTMYVNLLSIESREGKSFVAKYLTEQWEEQGFCVKYMVAEKDYPIDSAYLLATNFDSFINENEKCDILLIEHLAIQQNLLASALLQKADANLLIANACRVWKNSDDTIVSYLNGIAKNSPLFLYLNNASREAVEDFTGQLPPVTSAHTLASKMMYMGLTAKNTAVK